MWKPSSLPLCRGFWSCQHCLPTYKNGTYNLCMPVFPAFWLQKFVLIKKKVNCFMCFMSFERLLGPFTSFKSLAHVGISWRVYTFLFQIVICMYRTMYTVLRPSDTGKRNICVPLAVVPCTECSALYVYQFWKCCYYPANIERTVAWTVDKTLRCLLLPSTIYVLHLRQHFMISFRRGCLSRDPGPRRSLK